MRKVRERHLVPFVTPGPAEYGKVGHGQGSGNEPVLRQVTIQHTVEAPRLIGKSLEPVSPVPLVFQRDEMMHLSRHRTKASDLPHQPLQHRDSLAQRRRKEFTGPLAEIEQNRTRLEDADTLAVRAVGIDDCRNLVVGADGEKRRGVLRALGDIHWMHRVRKLHFLQCHADLATVRSIPTIQLNRHKGPAFGTWRGCIVDDARSALESPRGRR